MKPSWWIAAALVVGAGCGSKNTCVEGASAACACPGGGSGAQVCANGAYGACACSPTAAPAAPSAPAAAPSEPAASPPVAPVMQPVPPPTPPVDAAVAETPHDREVREAREKLDTISRDAQRVDHEINLAQRAVADAKTQAERDAAQAKLQKLQAESADINKRDEEAKRELDKAQHR